VTQDILQYASTIWNTADLLRGCGIKESEWPSYMMPFFALAMIESRLMRMLDELVAEHGREFLGDLDQEDLFVLAKGEKQGYNRLIFERRITLQEVCRNDKSFEVDFTAYLRAFDDETRDLLGVDADSGEKYLDIHGIVAKLKAKGVLFSYTAEWSRVDLKPFDNSAITTLEEHIKRQWADISAETAGEQYTPDDVISLIAEIIASKIEDSGTLLKIYDCTCGGGNLLFGVEDRINAKSRRLTQTFGQDWNDALYALARIEGRFRLDSKIAHGNTLTNDQFYNDTFDVVTANPPYGVSWKGYQKDILRDKTGRFKYLPSVSDGQLLFMQHLIAKLAPTGMGVVVHNGSTLFSGDAGSAESNIRKWMLDSDIVEAIIQLPTDEFFNTGIYTYLWVLNKAKAPARKDKVMLINASEKFQPLKKSKGAKRKAVDPQSRQEIVATLAAFQDNAFARVFDKEYFYFNKQALRLTNVDADGRSFAAQLKEGQKQRRLKPVRLTDGAPSGVHTWTEFEITASPVAGVSLYDYYNDTLKPQLAALDYKASSFVVETATTRFTYDAERDTLIQERKGQREALGCGQIEVKAAYKRATKTQPARIDIAVALAPDYEKDYEIIPYHADPAANDQAIAGFMARYITRPFELLDNVVGVEINFNKVFYQPEQLRPVADILNDIAALDAELKALEEALDL